MNDALTLSVVIPAYNEIRTVERLLHQVRQVPLNLEVIVVDDGSKDGTRDLLTRLKDEGKIDVLVFHEGVVIVGVSERTMERAVDRLVRALRTTNFFETLIMVPMPR